MLVWTSRHCPLCLRQDGAWRLGWQLCWCVACATHHVLLERQCPRCGLIPKIGTRWSRDEDRRLVDPTRCAHRINGELCLAPLSDANAQRASAAALKAQDRVEQVMMGRARPTLSQETLAGALQELADRRYHTDGRTLLISKSVPTSDLLRAALAVARPRPPSKLRACCPPAARLLSERGAVFSKRCEPVRRKRPPSSSPPDLEETSDPAIRRASCCSAAEGEVPDDRPVPRRADANARSCTDASHPCSRRRPSPMGRSSTAGRAALAHLAW